MDFLILGGLLIGAGLMIFAIITVIKKKTSGQIEAPVQSEQIVPTFSVEKVETVPASKKPSAKKRKSTAGNKSSRKTTGKKK